MLFHCTSKNLDLTQEVSQRRVWCWKMNFETNFLSFCTYKCALASLSICCCNSKVFYFQWICGMRQQQPQDSKWKTYLQYCSWRLVSGASSARVRDPPTPRGNLVFNGGNLSFVLLTRWVTWKRSLPLPCFRTRSCSLSIGSTKILITEFSSGKLAITNEWLLR